MNTSYAINPTSLEHLPPGTKLEGTDTYYVTAQYDSGAVVGSKLDGMTGNYRVRTKNGTEFVAKTGHGLPLQTAERCARRETRALELLAETAIAPRLHDTGHFGDRPFLVIQYIKGADLHSVIDKKPLPRALEYFIPLLEAVGEIHDHGIVHRDLKPQNVRLAEIAGTISPYYTKVMDFGLAKLETDGHSKPLVGTPTYAAPEQWTFGHSDKRSDIYSLGITLHECLTGKNAMTRLANFDQITEYKRQPLIDRSVPQRLRNVIEKATQPDPARRYQSTSEMMQDLQFTLRGRGL